MDFQSFMVKIEADTGICGWLVGGVWVWSTHKHTEWDRERRTWHLGCFVKMRLFYLLVNVFSIMCVYAYYAYIRKHSFRLPSIYLFTLPYLLYARSLSYLSCVFKTAEYVKVEQFVGIWMAFSLGIRTHTHTHLGYMNASPEQSIFNGACECMC